MKYGKKKNVSNEFVNMKFTQVRFWRRKTLIKDFRDKKKLFETDIFTRVMRYCVTCKNTVQLALKTMYFILFSRGPGLNILYVFTG